MTHRSGHPPPPPQPTLSSQVLAEAQDQEPIPKSRAFQKLNSPQRAPGAQPSPTHSPYPEAQRARLPGGARGFVLCKRPGPSKSSDLGGVLLRQKWADRSGLTTGKSSFSEGQNSPGRRQRGEKGVLVLSEKLLGTPEVTSKVHPPFGGGPEDGVLKAGRHRGRRWEWAWGGGGRTPLAEPQFRAPQFRGRGAAGGVSLTLSQLLPAWSSPQAHLRKAVRNARGNRRSPKCGPLARVEPRQPRAAAEPSPNSLPPATILPTCSGRNSGSERGAPPTWAQQSKTTCRVARPSKKKKARARAGPQRGRAARCASPGASHARTRLPVLSGRGSSSPGLSPPR